MQGHGKPACHSQLTQDEHAQQIANRPLRRTFGDSPRTAKLVDRTSDAISLDEIERILI
jgi:hypothetical protein